MKNKIRKQLVVGIRTESELSKEFLQAWKDAEKRNLSKDPASHLYFDSLDTLWRKLTPRRTELLQALRQKGPLSMRKLAFYLQLGLCTKRDNWWWRIYDNRDAWLI
jgi:predicted transcriptional regulator